MVAVTQRQHAMLNPLAVFREPMTLDDYLASRFIVSPLRRPDICMISDGGAALIVTAPERAADFPGKPVYLLAGEQQTSPRQYQNDDNLMRPVLRQLRDRVYDHVGIDRSDVDALYVQDPTSVSILQMLEGFGFVEPGESGPFIAEGRIALGSDLPVNTNGGQLSEAYMWGWLHICEAVRQLRGECGPRQVTDATFIQYRSTMGFQKVATSILGTVIPA
jgi:acetyl-CoA acetyltransferase